MTQMGQRPPPDYTDEEAQQVLPKHIAEMIEAGPEPEPPVG